MNLSQRFAALLGVFAGVFCGAIFILYWLQNQELDTAASATAKAQRQQLERALHLHGQHLETFSLDYSLWDELVGYLQNPTDEWIAINITPTLAKFEIDAVWICAADGQLIHSSQRQGPPPAQIPPLNISSSAADALTPRFVNYFMLLQGQPHEIRVSPIQPSSDINRETKPLGWLIAGRKLDRAYLDTVGQTADGRLTVCTAESTCGQTIDHDEIILTHRLRVPEGHPLLELHYQHIPILLRIHADADSQELFLLASHGVLLLVALSLALTFWVIRPIRLIKNSLTQANPDLLTPIRTTRSEMGDLARIVRTHYAHQKALQENMENSARLQRDLHDGVLQTIYAAGMGLALTRNLVRENPDEAERRLDQAGLQLNQLIRDIRSYLSHLTPDSHPALSLTESIQALIEWYKKLHPFEARLVIDPALPATLPLQLKSELLLLLREAISNSLRHAHTDRINLQLSVTPARRLVVEFSDNGVGFDLNKLTRQGHGLNNMKSRAQELGGTCQIASAPGKGTTITLEIPLPA